MKLTACDSCGEKFPAHQLKQNEHDRESYECPFCVDESLYEQLEIERQEMQYEIHRSS